MNKPARKVSEILRSASRASLLLVLAVALLGPVLLSVQYQLSTRSSAVYTPVVDTSSRLMIAMRWAQSDLRTDRTLGLPGVEDRLRTREAESRDAVRELQNLTGTDADFAPQLSELVRATDGWWDYANSVAGTTLDSTDISAPAPSPADNRRVADAVDDFATVIASADALNAIAAEKRVQLRTLRTRVLMGGSALAIGMVLLASMLIIRGTRRTAERIVNPVEDLNRVARADTDGGRGSRARTDRGPAEIRDLAVAFNALLDTRDAFESGREEQVRRLEELDRQKDDFVSTVSHELRTPLASIVGYTEMLCDGDGGELTGPQLRLVSVVQRNADRLRGLIEDLLVLSRIEARGLDTEHHPLSLDEVVGRVIESLSPVASHAGLTLAEEISPARVSGDALQLERAVTNLVSNAIKFTPRDGSVTVTLATEGDTATVTVSDTGIGIPAAEHEHLGTRFFRSSTAQRESIPGTGLGLSIVHAIAEAHDGALTFESIEGEGTSFRLTVPVQGRGAQPRRATA